MARRRSTEEALPIGFVSRPSAVSSKGQATIPAEIRHQVGIEPGDQVVFSISGGRVVLEKVQPIDEAWNAGQSAMLSDWNDPEQDVYND
jgi:AbrB family looped-hinge helix DNA binding protein